MSLRLLIIGGYGTFGGRVVRLLQHDPRLTMIVAGRSLEKATHFCMRHGPAEVGPGGAYLIPAAFDRRGDVEAQIAVQSPDIVVDASGPFQDYGPDGYRVIEACLALRLHYLDLADGAAFVEGVAVFDEAARAAGLFVLSGVSSFPVLTAAAVRRLSADMARVDRIAAGIAPSPFAGVGENVVRAMAVQAGQPAALNGGRTGYPFTDQRRWTIAPPGRVPLRPRLFSLVDAPDLRVLSALWPQAADVWMGAAPVPLIWHLGLIALSWLVRWRLLPTLAPLARLMHFATNRLRWGEHRGGMIVEVAGIDASGQGVIRHWHMLAEGDDGPFIPSMAVAVLVQKTLEGAPPGPGARACLTDVELADYERLFAIRKLYTGIRQALSPTAPLFERCLGALWPALPPEIRALHQARQASGRASVERGRGLLSRLTALAVGLPGAVEDIPVRVRFEAVDGSETWIRTFGATAFRSRLRAGTGCSDALLCETFGPLTGGMALVWEEGRLAFVLRRWSLFGVPLPRLFGPRLHVFEEARDGRFHFHVEITHPLAGLIVRYRGWLVPDAVP